MLRKILIGLSFFFLAAPWVWAAPIDVEALSKALASPEGAQLLRKFMAGESLRGQFMGVLFSAKLSQREIMDAASSVAGAEFALDRALQAARGDEKLAEEVESLVDAAGFLSLAERIQHQERDLARLKTLAKLEEAQEAEPSHNPYSTGPFEKPAETTGGQRIRWSFQAATGEAPDEGMLEWQKSMSAQLIEAFGMRDIRQLQNLLSIGGDPNTRIGADTLFTAAVDSDDRELVQVFLDDPRTDRNYKPALGVSAMTYAAANDDAELVADLLIGGVSPYVMFDPAGPHAKTGGYDFTASETSTKANKGEVKRMIDAARTWGLMHPYEVLQKLRSASMQAYSRGDLAFARLIDEMTDAAEEGRRVPILNFTFPRGTRQQPSLF